MRVVRGKVVGKLAINYLNRVQPSSMRVVPPDFSLIVETCVAYST